MSFEQQERALFDLLFNSTLREQFCRNHEAALKNYDLDESERLDFKSIRPEALQLDAAMRADLCLSQICKSLPISFSITSSIKGGIESLKQLVDTSTMQSKAIERAVVFGNRLGQTYKTFQFDSDKEQAIAHAILEAELGMAWTSASLKQMVLEDGRLPDENTVVREDWLTKAIKLADYVTASIFPQSYDPLKNSLCKVEDDCLWRHLHDKPLAVAVRKRTLLIEDPRLLLTKAYISRPSRCEPAVAFKTIELSEGFAPLLQHANGTMTVAEILAQLKQIGAEQRMLESIEAAFFQLLEYQMLESV